MNKEIGSALFGLRVGRVGRGSVHYGGIARCGRTRRSPDPVEIGRTGGQARIRVQRRGRRSDLGPARGAVRAPLDLITRGTTHRVPGNVDTGPGCRGG